MAENHNSFVESEALMPQKAAKPPRSRQKKAMEVSPKRILIWRMLKPFVSVGIGLVVVALLLVSAYNYVYREYFLPVDQNDKRPIEVTIKRNSSLTAISKQLEEEGIIRNAQVFKYYVDFSDMSSKLLAGSYELNRSMTFDDIIDVLKRPTDAKRTTNVLFKEGRTVEEYAQTLVSEGVLKNTKRFLELCETGEGFEQYEFVKNAIEANKTATEKRKYVLEGYLFPDTYEFFLSSAEEDIIEKLLSQFEKKYLDSYAEAAEELGMSMDDAVVLASIIEREAKKGDFDKVSAVFHNRMKKGEALGSCATHQYFMGERRLVWTSEELQIPSPYNTYINKGLPLGPICNPSQAAIAAAVHPNAQYIKEGYFYFCNGDPATGELLFSKTLKEHQKNQEKYGELWAEADKKNKTQQAAE